MSISSLFSKMSLPALALTGVAVFFAAPAAQAGKSTLKQVDKWQTAYQNLQKSAIACKHATPSKVGQMVVQDKCLEKAYLKYGPTFYGNIWPQFQEMVLSYRLQIAFTIDRGSVDFTSADESLQKALQQIGVIDYQQHSMMFANKIPPVTASAVTALKAPGLSFLN